MTTETAVTNGILGYLDVRPDSSAQFLIDNGYAVDAKGADNLPDPKDGKQAFWAGLQATLFVDPAPSVLTSPTISGDAANGSLLTCEPGEYFGIPAPTITRTWRSNGTIIPGETGLTYTTTVTDVGAAISVLEEATNSEGSVSAGSNEITIT
jgi:hypothetical protein